MNITRNKKGAAQRAAPFLYHFPNDQIITD
jgi:hypothetical protein